VILLSLPRDVDVDKELSKRNRRKEDRNHNPRKEEKGWRNKPKRNEDTIDVDLEDLMMKINHQFRCNKCQNISSIYAENCSICDAENPAYPPNA